MTNFHDYYRQKAIESRPAVRDIRSVIPNGDDFRSRGYGIHLEARRIPDSPARMPREFTDAKTREIACRVCSAKPGEPCISSAKGREGAALTGFHAQRTSDAHANWRKKP